MLGRLEKSSKIDINHVPTFNHIIAAVISANIHAKMELDYSLNLINTTRHHECVFNSRKPGEIKLIVLGQTSPCQFCCA